MISICLATFNGEKYIRQQLDSILNQIGDNDEVIVSDDGSSDRTLDIISEYSDERIKIFTHKKNKTKYRFYAISKNFENALSRARGDYIFFSDQDDIWIDGKVKECIHFLENGYDLVLHNATPIGDNGQILEESYFARRNSGRGFLKNIFRNSYLGCCMAITRGFLEKALPFPDIPVPHDLWVGLIYEHYGNVIHAEKCLVFYRRHSSNASCFDGEKKNSLFFKFKYRAYFLLAFLGRIMRF